MKAAAVGFTCIDVYEDGRRYATGNGVNVLFHLKKMRKDLEGAVVTAVGKDDYGQLMDWIPAISLLWSLGRQPL